MIYTDEIFNTQGESVSLADMNAGSSAVVGTYAARLSGRLIKVILLWAGEAATSLFENVRVEINCTLFSPNLLKFGLVGAGIRTAPAAIIPPGEWQVDQPVATQQPLSAQYIYASNATPITANLRVFGVFYAA